jgi:cytochrome bd-type quinol oxidase subunit 2
MEYYPTLITLHIIFAGGWIISLVTDSFLKQFISRRKGLPEEKTLISLYLNFSNLIGIIGSIGILLTGIIMVIMNPGYGFFQMTANHWLTTKQILTVVLLIVIFVFVIPNAKKLRKSINDEISKQESLGDEAYKNLSRAYRLNIIINVIVLINFLFAITHRFLG